MAIYRNREVSVTPNPVLTTPETITVRYLNDTTEIVPFSMVRYTDAEKKDLIKKYPSKFELVDTVTDADLKAVRAGLPPSYDVSIEPAPIKVKK